ncbi:MAG: DUF1156 domain-containing protein, partial [Deltaproteobacteria bacterium]
MKNPSTFDTNSSYCPRLIEVALPIREISAESVRDKSLRHGHISTLHLWWARRPLPASRAVVFASLVPDPDDPRCPKEFQHAVERHLKTHVSSELKYYRRGREFHRDEDPYHPYDGIADTLRNRLLTFIAKWSPEALAFETGKSVKEPKPAELLDDRSLVKWEISNPENSQGREVLRIAREIIKTAHGGRTPTVLDPFAGGGAIPLEAGRLGCQPIANDYNPVAYLILRATCEFPQKYGKPGRRKVVVGDFGKKVEREIEVPNVLVHDVEKWANWILKKAKNKIGHLYPPGKDGRPAVGYLWARTAPCSNPSCMGEIPLLRTFLICNKKEKKVVLTMQVDKKNQEILFGIAKDRDIQRTEGTMQSHGNVKCPFCEQVTSVADLRIAGISGKMGERMVAVIIEGKNGKDYRMVEETDVKSFYHIQEGNSERPKEILPHFRNINLDLYGLTTWGSLFNSRQILVVQTFVDCLHEAFETMRKEIRDYEYCRPVMIYLGLWVSRIVQRSSNVGLWDTTRETLQHPFGRQAIPMTWDYPEANPFSESTGSAEGGVDWIKRVLLRESASELTCEVICGDSACIALEDNKVDLVVTDPPYFDSIAYSDISDYFYIWLKRSLGNIIPEIFGTPLTPKTEEATALKHHHGGDEQKADAHFKLKLTQAFAESHRMLNSHGLVSIMFAHQSTKAWSALIHAI